MNNHKVLASFDFGGDRVEKIYLKDYQGVYDTSIKVLYTRIYRYGFNTKNNIIFE